VEKGKQKESTSKKKRSPKPTINLVQQSSTIENHRGVQTHVEKSKNGGEKGGGGNKIHWGGGARDLRLAGKK